MDQSEQPIQIPNQTLALKKPSNKKQKQGNINNNQLLYQLFVRKDFPSCLRLITTIQNEYGELHGFSNYIKGLIQRMEGNIAESVTSLKKCLLLDHNIEVLKYISKNLYFLGRYKASIEVSHDALLLGEDWEIYFTIGQCYYALKDGQKSLQNFQKAYELSKNETTIIQLGRMYTLNDNLKEAVNVYTNGLQVSLQNSELMTVLGILYLRLGDNDQAMLFLEQAAEIDSKDQRNLLGLASILQDRSEYDQSLSRYRQLLILNPNSCKIWNNIGMCFYGKRKLIAAIACLKKALYFDPFEWITHYNLGLVHIATQQYSSAFHFFSSAIQLKSDYAESYMYLAITLNHLDDFTNSCRAMERAIELDTENDFIIYLNYCIIQIQNGKKDQRVREYFNLFETQYQKMDVDTRWSHDEINAQRKYVANILGIKVEQLILRNE